MLNLTLSELNSKNKDFFLSTFEKWEKKQLTDEICCCQNEKDYAFFLHFKFNIPFENILKIFENDKIFIKLFEFEMVKNIIFQSKDCFKIQTRIINFSSEFMCFKIITTKNNEFSAFLKMDAKGIDKRKIDYFYFKREGESTAGYFFSHLPNMNFPIPFFILKKMMQAIGNTIKKKFIELSQLHE